MKKKELKNLAQRIAKAELNIQNGIDVEKSKELIMRLSSSVDFQDIDTLDEMIQELLKNS